MAKLKVLAQNKKARYDYFIEDAFEAGMVLTGTEIKSMRAGKTNLKESYAKVINNEVFIIGMNISPYEQGNIYNVDPLRVRKLLLKKKEIQKLLEYTTQDGLTLVPLSVYLNEKGMAKMELGVGKGKKNYDKRETIAKRDSERRIKKQMSEKHV